MPYMISEADNQFCVHKQNADGTAGEQLKCYADKGEAEKYLKALHANMPMKEKMMQKWGEIMSLFDLSDKTEKPLVQIPVSEADNVFFTDLSDFEHISTIDGLPATPDPVTDMHGQVRMVHAEDLQSYIDNTNRLLETTKDANGNIIGLPIDKEKHDHQGGAGWIVGLELDNARKLIKFIVNWTADGVSIVKNNVRRFFSPSFDPQQKVILGGSLTNSPAARDKNWNYLLRPVEMSTTLKELDMSKTVEEQLADFKKEMLEIMKAGKPAASAENPGLELSTDENDKLAELAEKQFNELVRISNEKQAVVKFVAELAGGTNGHGVGFAIPTKNLTAFLLAQPEATRKEFQKYLTMMATSAVDFAEHGISGEGFLHRPHLPAEYQTAATEWVKAGKTMKEFFKEVATDLSYEDYNVAEFEKEKV